VLAPTPSWARAARIRREKTSMSAPNQEVAQVILKQNVPLRSKAPRNKRLVAALRSLRAALPNARQRNVLQDRDR
jgi:hypothetical protein